MTNTESSPRTYRPVAPMPDGGASRVAESVRRVAEFGAPESVLARDVVPHMIFEWQGKFYRVSKTWSAETTQTMECLRVPRGPEDRFTSGLYKTLRPKLDRQLVRVG